MQDQTTPNLSLAALMDAMHAVHALLEDERQALIARDADRLQDIAARKESLLVEASDLREQAGIEGDESDHQELSKVTANCRRLNEINGALIRGQQRRVERMLNILRGVPEESSVYDRDGTNPALAKTRKTLASA